MEMNNTTHVYSVFSGTLYEILTSDLKYLDDGQIPLSSLPKKNCKKCYGKLSYGRDAHNLSYFPCSCLRKVVNLDIVKSLENFRTH